MQEILPVHATKKNLEPALPKLSMLSFALTDLQNSIVLIQTNEATKTGPSFLCDL